jgi:RpiR family transcriptional regulator, carbohydrate utilization regulator
MKNHTGLSNTTATLLAEATDTSPATIIRFCRSIGFKGLLDFKMYLRNEFSSPSSQWLNVDFNESIAMIKQKTFGFNRNSMDETLSILDDEYLKQAVELIDKAPQVAIVGEGGSGTSARAAFDAFLQIGIQCLYIEDPFFQVLGIARMPKGSVVLGFNHSGQAKNIVDSMKLAKRKGLTTIGLIGIIGSPIMKYVDIPLITGITDHPFFSDSLAARICELNVVSTLHAILAIKRKDNLGDYREEVTDLLSIKRLRK